ncbi:MAG: hypothetical protein ACRESJ_27515 [Pseudomonas sp.]|uniref:hypothetical protein n=1 Tax=Pseudomonas sp. TaxID=306 RepID=UPI003D6FF1D2
MNYLGTLQPLLDTMKWLIQATLLIGLLKKSCFKGWLGERLARVFAHYRLDRQSGAKILGLLGVSQVHN